MMRAALFTALLSSLTTQGSRMTVRFHQRKPDGISTGVSSQIDAVSETLRDILASVEAAEKEEASNYKCFMEWCHKEVTAGANSLEGAKELSEQGQVEKKELEALLESLAHTLTEAKKEIEETTNMIDQATTLRADAKAKYEDEMQLNTQSLDQVNRAIKIVGGVGKAGFFLQGGVKRRLQLNEPGESSYVLGIIKGIKEKLDKSQKEMEETETKDEQKNDALLSTKQGQVAELQTEKADAGEKTTQAGVQLAQTRHAVKKAAQQIEELSKFMEETTSQCDAKKAWWHRRGEDRLQEKAALKQAINYVEESMANAPASAAPASFLQLRSGSPSFFQASSVKGAQFSALEAVLTGAAATGGNKGMLDGAKKIVNDLIAVLIEEGKGEETKNKYCNKEIDSKDIQRTGLKDEIEQLSAVIEEKQSQILVLSNEVPQINATANELLVQLKAAKVVRKKEATDYGAQKKDRVLAVKVLRQAKEVLRQFYATKDNSALLAVANGATLSAPPPTASGSSRKDTLGFNVMQLLDTIIDDIVKESSEADTEETQANGDFERLAASSIKEYDEQMSNMGDKLKQKAKLQVNMGTNSEDKASKEEDLSSTEAQLTSLHDSCDDLLQHFEKRVEARDFEVSQLRDVLDILSGSSIASRTGFLEQTLLQDMVRKVSGIRNAQ